jgi:hypothetical protein
MPIDIQSVQISGQSGDRTSFDRPKHQDSRADIEPQSGDVDVWIPIDLIYLGRSESELASYQPASSPA